MVGQQSADAQAVLAANGLRASVVEVSDEVAPVGEVLRTDPGPGERIGRRGLPREPAFLHEERGERGGHGFRV